MIRFYAPDIKTDSILPEVESGHCCRVLRHRIGDEIEVIDGKGNLFRCVIEDANPKKTRVDILEETSLALHWTPKITLAVAPTKNIDRMEWLVEKSVEIGVNKIVFLNCKNSVRRMVKRERIEKILISSMKQSLKATLPELIEMIDIVDFLHQNVSDMKFVGYCDSSIERKEFVKEYDGRSDLTILIGPEGDFTSDEIRLAFERGYKPVTFGNTRLRTETAALYSLCATHTLINLYSL